MPSLLQRFRQQFRAWLSRPTPPSVIDLTESSRRQALRDAEWQAEADRQSRVLRSSRTCRMAERQRVAGVIVRERVRERQQ